MVMQQLRSYIALQGLRIQKYQLQHYRPRDEDAEIRANAESQRSEGQKSLKSKSEGARPAGSGPELKDK